MSKRSKAVRRQRYFREIYEGKREGQLPAPECWCGVKNPYFHPQRGGCGGSGYFNCHCGGDICVCHNHGEMECFGCEDCRFDEDYDDDFYGEEAEASHTSHPSPASRELPPGKNSES